MSVWTRFRTRFRVALLALGMLACVRPCSAGYYAFDGAYHGYEIVGNVADMAIADMNGDGVNDLVFTNLAWPPASYWPQTPYRAISVVLGPIRESPVKQLDSFIQPSLVRPQAFAIADFDEDRIPDVATAGDHGGGVYLGIGDGHFQTTPSAALGSLSRRMRAADLDRDGHADLVLSSGRIAIVRGRGDGTFSAAETLNVAPSDGYDFMIGDLDGDTWLDLFVTGSQGPRYYGKAVCLMNNRDGTFRTVELGPGVGLAVVADVTGDGLPDPIAFNSGYLHLWENLGHGTFAAGIATDYGYSMFHPRDILDADVNRDGHTDLVAAPPLLVMLGNGNGSFSVTTYPMDLDFDGIAVGDLDGDGVSDAVVPRRDGFAVAPGRPDGTFRGGGIVTPMPTSGRTWMATDDLNGDGRLDAVVVRSVFGDTLSVLLGDDSGAFVVRETHAIGPGRLEGDPLRIADVNSDGRPDVLLTRAYGSSDPLTYANELLTFLNHGDSFGAPSRSSTSEFPQSVAVADLDEDELPDAVVSAYSSSSRVFVLDLMRGRAGTFTRVDQLPFATSGLPIAVAIADVNEDGIADVVRSGSFDRIHVLAIHLATSPWQYSGPTEIQVTGRIAGIAVANLNQDAHLDVIFTEVAVASDSSLLSVCLGRGDGTFTEPRSFGRSWGGMGAIVLVDMNRDGFDDAVVRETATARIHLGDGRGAFGPPLVVGYTSGFSVGDFDRDTYPDLVGFGPDGLLALRNQFRDLTTPIRAPVFTAESQSGRVVLHVSFTAQAPNRAILRRAPSTEGPWVAITDTLRDRATVTFVDSTAMAGMNYYDLEAWDGAGFPSTYGPIAVFVRGAGEFAIVSIAPNPARDGAEIVFSLGRAATVRVGIYDVQGREIASLVNGERTSGRHRVEWKARGPSGHAAPGLYFVRYQTPEKTFRAKLVVLP